MTATLLDVVAAIQAHALAVGARGAPVAPPEAISQFPFSTCYAAEGSISSNDASFKTGLHTFLCEIHFSRQSLPAAITAATPYIETMAARLLADPTLGGTVSTIVGSITYTFGYLDWGGVAEVHIGPQFRITVKMQGTL